MIRVEELRIGNYTDKGIIKNFYENGIHVGLGKCYVYNVINPIPLTEEILLKCGFEKDGVKWPSYRHFKFKTLTIEIGVLGDKYSFRKYLSKDKSLHLVDIKYLNQLQNLYFALTGEELEINL